MKKKNKSLKIYKFDEIKDEFVGKKGTQKREDYDSKLAKQKNFLLKNKRTKK